MKKILLLVVFLLFAATAQAHAPKLKWRSMVHVPPVGMTCLVKKQFYTTFGLVAKYEIRNGQAMWAMDAVTHVDRMPVSASDKWQSFAKIDKWLSKK